MIILLSLYAYLRSLSLSAGFKCVGFKKHFNDDFSFELFDAENF
jgi:hypothetical protein